MDFNEEDRIDKEIDMDAEYDMMPMPMPGGVPVPGIMPVEMPLNMQGNMGMQGLMPLMMKPLGVEMSPTMIPNINSNVIPNMMNVEHMLPSSMDGMNMMEQDDYEDMDEDMDEEMTRKKEYGPKEINKILMKMEKYNPGIFRYLRMYGVPFAVAKKILRRIIRITLMYYED